MNPHAKALGKLGGKVKSEAKAAAARENGKKGGRPKRSRHTKLHNPYDICRGTNPEGEYQEEHYEGALRIT